MDTISWKDFEKVHIAVGEILEVSNFPEARNPSYKLVVHFGDEIGTKKTSAQITQYKKEELVGTQVVAVVNFPPKQIGPFMSEVLVLGLPNAEEQVTLLRPDTPVPVGGRMY